MEEDSATTAATCCPVCQRNLPDHTSTADHFVASPRCRKVYVGWIDRDKIPVPTDAALRMALDVTRDWDTCAAEKKRAQRCMQEGVMR